MVLEEDVLDGDSKNNIERLMPAIEASDEHVVTEFLRDLYYTVRNYFKN